MLLIDNDPQASLTQGFFGPEGMRAFRPEATVAATYDLDADLAPETLIRPTDVSGVSIVPGSIALTDWNLPPRMDWGGVQFGLGAFLARGRRRVRRRPDRLPPELAPVLLRRADRF